MLSRIELYDTYRYGLSSVLHPLYGSIGRSLEERWALASTTRPSASHNSLGRRVLLQSYTTNNSRSNNRVLPPERAAKPGYIINWSHPWYYSVTSSPRKSSRDGICVSFSQHWLCILECKKKFWRYYILFSRIIFYALRYLKSNFIYALID
jgi:hypothetical protein